MVRMTSRVGTGVRERLVSAIDALCELTQDFTDSAYTTHHHREQVRVGWNHVFGKKSSRNYLKRNRSWWIICSNKIYWT